MSQTTAPQQRTESKSDSKPCRDGKPCSEPVNEAGTPAFLGGQVQKKSDSPGSNEDHHEREADRAADQVANGSPGRPSLSSLPGHAGGCGCSACAAKSKPCSGTPKLGPGTPLPPFLRASFEPRFGRSLASVRVHDDSRAHALSRSINAKAFASGSDIAFAPGAYRPETPAGRHLVAHEVAHTIQQGGAPRAIQRQEAGTPAPADVAKAALATADEIYAALDGWNNEQRAINALQGRTTSIDEVKSQFAAKHGSLEAYLKDQLSGAWLVKAFALLSSTNLIEPHTEMALALIPLGTRDEEVFRVLDSLPLAGRQTMATRYNAAFGSIGKGSLVNDLIDDLSGWRKQKSIAMLLRDLTPADHLYFNSVAIVGTHTDSVIAAIQDTWSRGPAAFVALDSDWNTNVKGQRNGCDEEWTQMGLVEAMSDELSGESWELVKAAFDGYRRYTSLTTAAPGGTVDDWQVEEVQLTVARDTLTAATTGGYTGAGTNEAQVFRAVGTLRTIWNARIDRETAKPPPNRLQDAQDGWKKEQEEIAKVAIGEMDEDSADYQRVRLLQLGDLRPADEIYLAKVDLDTDAAVAAVTQAWATGALNAVVSDASQPRVESGKTIRPQFDPLFVVPVTSGLPFRRIQALLGSDRGAQAGAARLALEIEEGDNDSDLQRAYRFVTTAGISPSLRGSVIDAYASRITDAPGQPAPKRFVAFVARRYANSHATHLFRDLLDPTTDPREFVARAEARNQSAHSGLLDERGALGYHPLGLAYRGAIAAYEEISGEQTSEVAQEALDRLRYIALKAKPEEIEVLILMTGTRDINGLARFSYDEFDKRLEDVRELKHAVAEALATAAELAINAAITVATGGAAAGLLVASLTSAIAGMLLREAALGQDYDLISEQNAAQLVIIVAGAGFGAASQGAFHATVNPETIKALGRTGLFIEGAVTEIGTQVGTKFTETAIEGRLPTAESLAAGAVAVVGHGLGSGAGRSLGHSSEEATAAAARLRRSVAGMVAQEVVGGAADESASLIRTGVGDLSAGQIAGGYGRSAAQSLARGIVNGAAIHGGEQVAAGRRQRAEGQAREELDRISNEQEGSSPKPPGTVIEGRAARGGAGLIASMALKFGHVVSLVRDAVGRLTCEVCSHCDALLNRIEEAKKHQIEGLDDLRRQVVALLPEERTRPDDPRLREKLESIGRRLDTILSNAPEFNAVLNHEPVPVAAEVAPRPTNPGEPRPAPTPTNELASHREIEVAKRQALDDLNHEIRTSGIDPWSRSQTPEQQRTLDQIKRRYLDRIAALNNRQLELEIRFILPPPPGSNLTPATATPGALRQIAVELHNLRGARAGGNIAVERTAFALVELVIPPNGTRQVWASVSGERGFTAPERARLAQLGVVVVQGSRHAEQNLDVAVRLFQDSLQTQNPGVTTSVTAQRWGISWTTPQYNVPCTVCRLTVVQRLGGDLE